MRKMVMFVSFRKQPKLLEWCMTKIVITSLKQCNVDQSGGQIAAGLQVHRHSSTRIIRRLVPEA